MIALTSKPPVDFNVLFLDMDAFFASCEQQMRPELRGKPVGVTPVLQGSSIISPSYEAKRAGVRGVTRNWIAQQICPEITLVEARPHVYKEIHYKILDVMQQFTPWIIPKSIDEMAVPLSPSERSEEHAVQLAQAIKQALAKAVGPYITASIGFGPNQFLAKVASDMDKPNGVSIITIQTIEEQLSKLEMTDLPGIATKSARRLKAHNLYTTTDLLRADHHTLRQVFGFMGEVWWHRLHGYEVDDITTHRSSIGHSHILEKQWRTPDKAYQVLTRLVHKVGQRLRRENVRGRYSTLTIKYVGGEHESFYTRTAPYSDSRFMQKIAHDLFDKRTNTSEFILGLVFTMTGLEESTAHAQSLFPEFDKPLSISKALDSINDTYGRDTIFPASMLHARSTAPDRIPFGKLRY